MKLAYQWQRHWYEPHDSGLQRSMTCHLAAAAGADAAGCYWCCLCCHKAQLTYRLLGLDRLQPIPNTEGDNSPDSAFEARMPL